MTGSKFMKKLRGQAALQMITLLGMIWLFIFCYIPMGGIYIAFSDYNIAKPIFDAPWAGLKYFGQFLKDPNIYKALRNTLAISFLHIVVGFPVPIIFAVLLNELRNLKFKKVVQTISYLPHFVSWVILGGFLISWTSETGLINEVLLRLHLIQEPVYLLAEPKYFWGTAVLSSIWKEMGWSAIIYIAAITGISPELYEAAVIDGASRFQRICHITLPCILGTIAILFTFTIAGLLNSNFDQIFVLKNTLNADTSTVLDIYVYRMGIQLGRFSYATAVGLLKSIISLGLLLLSNKVSDKLTGSSFI
jgi:putative aldouronate transport system permease protein